VHCLVSAVLISLTALSGEYSDIGTVPGGDSILDSEVQASFSRVSMVVLDQSKTASTYTTLIASEIAVRRPI
jgi:hypothetical protein